MNKTYHSTTDTLMLFKCIRSRTSILTFLAFLSEPVWAEKLDLRFEVKANYRYSQQADFPSQPFPFPATALTESDSNAFIETVDEGSHGEVSLVSMAGKWQFADSWQLQFKVDAIDLYDRNPTSTDKKIDIDSFVLRYGNTFGATTIPSENSFYAQLGKFKKFEQQRERRTESYGVVSTAFNRFEDSGIETGFDLSAGFYGRLSYTTGNPVFLRDVNALAGDNGTEDLRVPSNVNSGSNLNNGIVTLYDAEVEDFDLSTSPELGVGLGYRWNSAKQNQKLDVLAYHYQRDLSDTREINGTFLGGDLDLFDLSEFPGAEGVRLPFTGKEKTESGLSAWYYAGDFSVFSQYVKQEVANLDRDGFEIELSYVFNTPITITPVVRYSELNNNFVSDPTFFTPSLQWDWRKIDYGINFDFTDNVRLIVEYADNEVLRAGRWESQNELLLTLRWQASYKR
ncbi:hypothetical protein [Arenicella xantha]|uniref:Beta-barrel porin 2 n=1 Tax=Arenicella xantha TaxID=644221 RepID=A0A395JGG4_9GAMM|nr:hypothetical protein [Arenicella xantha]RBP48556.1 hypothetical protein DFR28_10642 [Arenicella xantha]